MPDPFEAAFQDDPFAAAFQTDLDPKEIERRATIGSFAPRDSGAWKTIAQHGKDNGFTVVAGYDATGKKHNVNSQHYTGDAVDFRTKDKKPEEVDAFIANMKSRGFYVRDERTKPEGQKVWGGPHIHVAVPRGVPLLEAARAGNPALDAMLSPQPAKAKPQQTVQKPAPNIFDQIVNPQQPQAKQAAKPTVSQELTAIGGNLKKKQERVNSQVMSTLGKLDSTLMEIPAYSENRQAIRTALTQMASDGTPLEFSNVAPLVYRTLRPKGMPKSPEFAPGLGMTPSMFERDQIEAGMIRDMPTLSLLKEVFNLGPANDFTVAGATKSKSVKDVALTELGRRFGPMVSPLGYAVGGDEFVGKATNFVAGQTVQIPDNLQIALSTDASPVERATAVAEVMMGSIVLDPTDLLLHPVGKVLKGISKWIVGGATPAEAVRLGMKGYNLPDHLVVQIRRAADDAAKALPGGETKALPQGVRAPEPVIALPEGETKALPQKSEAPVQNKLATPPGTKRTESPGRPMWEQPKETPVQTGSPVSLKAYHATDKEFSEFDLTKAGSGLGETDHPSAWFHANPDWTNMIADRFASRNGKTVPVDLSFKNPLVIDAADYARRTNTLDQSFMVDGERLYDVRWFKNIALRDALDGGHDGVIIKGGYDLIPIKGDVYAALDSKTAKITAAKTSPTPEPTVQSTAKEPWQMTREEIAADPRFKLVEQVGDTLARRRGGVTELTPKYFDLPPEDRKFLLIHENGHDLIKPEEGLDRWKDVIEPFRINRDTTRYSAASRYENPFGIRTEPEEMLADGYRSLFDERTTLPDGSLAPVFKAGSPKDNLRRAIAEQALKDGKPVPPEVLADYPDLAKKYPVASEVAGAPAKPYTRYIEPERDLGRIVLGSEHPADINKVIDWVRSMRDVPYESGGNTRMIVLNALKKRPGLGAERGSEPLFEALINAVDKGRITPQNGLDLLEAANPTDFGFGPDISQAVADFRKRYNLNAGADSRVSGLTPKTKADKKIYEALASDPDARVVIYQGKVKGGGYHEFVDVTWYNKEKGRTNKPAGIPDAYASAKASELSPAFRDQLVKLDQPPVAPEVAGTPAVEPWQMSKAEFASYMDQPGSYKGQRGLKESGNRRRGFMSPSWVEAEHRDAVLQALADGKPVPQHVVDEVLSNAETAKPGTQAGAETGRSGQPISPDLGETNRANAASPTPEPPPSPSATPSAVPTEYGATNKIVTRERYEAAKKRAITYDTGSGKVDLKALVEMGVYHLEAGTRAFADWSKRMVDDLGESVREHLPKVWRDAHREMGVREPLDVVSTVAHEDMDEFRRLAGLPERGPRGLPDSELEAQAIALKPQAEAIAARVNSDNPTFKKAKPVSDAEQIAMGMRLKELKGELDAASKAGDSAAWDAAWERASVLADALDKAGSETGAALRARQFLLENQMDEFSITRRAEKAKGNALDAGERQKVKEIAAEDAANVKEVEDARKAEAEAKAEAVLKNEREDAPMPKGKSLEAIRARREWAAKQIREELAKAAASPVSMILGAGGGGGIAPDVLKFRIALREYAYTLVDEGLVHLDDVVKRIVNDFPGLDHQRVIDELAAPTRDATTRTEAAIKRSQLIQEAKKLSTEGKAAKAAKDAKAAHAQAVKEAKAAAAEAERLEKAGKKAEAKAAKEAQAVKDAEVKRLDDAAKRLDDAAAKEQNKRFEKESRQNFRISNLQKRIDELKKMQEAGEKYVPTKSGRAEVPEVIKDLEKQKKELEKDLMPPEVRDEPRMKEIEQQLAELDRRFKENDFRKTTKKERETSQARRLAEEKLKRRRAQFNATLRSMEPKTAAEKFENFFSGMQLFSVQGRVKDVLGNSIRLGGETGESYMRAGIMKKLSGLGDGTWGAMGVNPANGFADMFDETYKEAIGRRMGDAWEGQDVAMRAKYGGVSGWGHKAAGVSDVAFAEAYRRAYIVEWATDVAKQSGMKDKDFVKQLIADAPENVLDEAEEWSRRMTYNNANWVSNMKQKVDAEFKKAYDSKYGKHVKPAIFLVDVAFKGTTRFSKVIGNIGTNFGRNSPLGVLEGFVRLMSAKGEAKAGTALTQQEALWIADAFTKGTVGTVGWALAYLAYKRGVKLPYVFGREMQSLDKDGERTNSYWWDPGNARQIASGIPLAAQLGYETAWRMSKHGDDKGENIATSTLNTIADNALNQPFLAGGSRLMDDVKKNGVWDALLSLGLAKSIPGVLTETAAEMDSVPYYMGKGESPFYGMVFERPVRAKQSDLGARLAAEFVKKMPGARGTLRVSAKRTGSKKEDEENK